MRLTLGHFRPHHFSIPFPAFGLTAVLVASLVLFINYRYAGETAVPADQPELTGEWIGRQAITVRLKQGWKHHSFVSAGPVETRIRINADGVVTGTAGDAVFTDCKVHKSRGHILRLLQIGTDFEIRGWLAGAVFPGDTITMKPISIPFDLSGNRMTGTFFHLQKGGLYPMAGGFGMSRAATRK